MAIVTVEKALKEAELCRDYQDIEIFRLFILDPLQEGNVVSVGDIKLYERKALRHAYANILKDASYNAEKPESYPLEIVEDALKIARELGIDEKIVKARFTAICETVDDVESERQMILDDMAFEESMKFRADYSWD